METVKIEMYLDDARILLDLLENYDYGWGGVDPSCDTDAQIISKSIVKAIDEYQEQFEKGKIKWKK